MIIFKRGKNMGRSTLSSLVGTKLHLSDIRKYIKLNSENGLKFQ